MGKRDSQRKVRLEKQTIRTLDARPLTAAELEQVAGGAIRRTWRCVTICP